MVVVNEACLCEKDVLLVQKDFQTKFAHPRDSHHVILRPNIMVNSCNSFTTIVTTPQYCIGAIVLAKSLKIVKTIYKLRIYVTAPSLESQLLVLGTTHDVLDTIEVLPLNIDEFFEGSTPVENFLDSPRRQLYKLNEPFVYLDCDMIVAQNIDSLMNLIDLKDDTTEFECYAVANFRNKKRAFADVSNSNSMGNFNAGLMVCTKPSTFPALYKCCAEILSDPQFNDTEEKLLNDVYKVRHRSERANDCGHGYIPSKLTKMRANLASLGAE